MTPTHKLVTTDGQSFEATLNSKDIIKLGKIGKDEV